MILKAILFLITIVNIYAVEVTINSDNFKTIYQTLTSEDNIAKIVHEKRVPFSTLQVTQTDNYDNNSQRSYVQKEYAKLQKIRIFLPGNTKKSDLQDSFREAFFRQFAQEKEEHTFVYKIKYESFSNKNGDQVFDDLQKEISLYILQKYGISNIKDNVQIDNNLLSSVTQNYTIGTTESSFLNNYDNPYKYEGDTTIRSGVVSFIFYPFVLSKKNHQTLSNHNDESDEGIQKEFVEVDKTFDLTKIPFSLYDEDKEKINLFLQKIPKEKRVATAATVNTISNKVIQYTAATKKLFSNYPQCNDTDCLENAIKKKLDSFEALKMNKLYVYNIDLSNDDDFEYVVLPAFRKVQKYLRRDTNLNSFENTEKATGTNYDSKTSGSKFVAVIKTITITPYSKERGKLGLNFKVNVSFEEADVCSQYYKGVSKDRLHGMKFIKLAFNNQKIEISQTEVTNRLFNAILPREKREKNCQRTQGANKPVNCVSYETLDRFLKKLNRKSRKYRYRYLTCKESNFITTCGDKQKYCWGNQKEYENFEFLRQGKYDLTLKNVKSYQKNFLNLYDLCGNAAEYCTDKRGWYKTFGSTTKHLKPLIIKNNYSDISSIRLVRERR